MSNKNKKRFFRFVTFIILSAIFAASLYTAFNFEAVKERYLNLLPTREIIKEIEVIKEIEKEVVVEVPAPEVVRVIIHNGYDFDVVLPNEDGKIVLPSSYDNESDFLGWFTSSGVMVDNDTVYTETTVVIPRFEQQHSIVFIDMNTFSVISSINVKHASSVLLPEDVLNYVNSKFVAGYDLIVNYMYSYQNELVNFLDLSEITTDYIVYVRLQLIPVSSNEIIVEIQEEKFSIVAETFSQLFEQLDLLEKPSNFEAWYVNYDGNQILLTDYVLHNSEMPDYVFAVFNTVNEILINMNVYTVEGSVELGVLTAEIGQILNTVSIPHFEYEEEIYIFKGFYDTVGSYYVDEYAAISEEMQLEAHFEQHFKIRLELLSDNVNVTVIVGQKEVLSVNDSGSYNFEVPFNGVFSVRALAEEGYTIHSMYSSHAGIAQETRELVSETERFYRYDTVLGSFWVEVLVEEAVTEG